MFGEEAPPLPWDGAGAYTREALEVYAQSGLSPPLSPRQLRGWLAGGSGAAEAGVSEAAAAEERRRRAAGAAAGEAEAGPAAAPRLTRLEERVPLRQALAAAARAGFVLPGGTAVLFAVARGTPFRDAFLRTGLREGE